MTVHGWSSPRGRARHLVATDTERCHALCGSPVRFTSLDGFGKEKAKKLRALEICDHCQTANRRAKA